MLRTAAKNAILGDDHEVTLNRSEAEVAITISGSTAPLIAEEAGAYPPEKR